MSDGTIERRTLLGLAGIAGITGLAGAAALCAGCTGTSVALPPQGSRSGKAAPTGTTTPSVPPSPTARPPASLTTDLPDVAHGPRTVPAVALTFHGAGSATLTKQILAELAAAQVHVTVFAVGNWLVAEPALARLVLDGGHELGNHTYTHLPMRQLAPATARSEVARCAAVLRRLTGTPGAWFRPSGTPASNTTIRAAARAGGYPFCLTYDVDSLDWTDPAPATITRQVMAKVAPGSIVSLHLGHRATVTALPSVLSALAARSLTPVTVSRLLG